MTHPIKKTASTMLASGLVALAAIVSLSSPVQARKNVEPVRCERGQPCACQGIRRASNSQSRLRQLTCIDENKTSTRMSSSVH